MKYDTQTPDVCSRVSTHTPKAQPPNFMTCTLEHTSGVWVSYFIFFSGFLAPLMNKEDGPEATILQPAALHESLVLCMFAKATVLHSILGL